MENAVWKRIDAGDLGDALMRWDSGYNVPILDGLADDCAYTGDLEFEDEGEDGPEAEEMFNGYCRLVEMLEAVGEDPSVLAFNPMEDPSVFDGLRFSDLWRAFTIGRPENLGILSLVPAWEASRLRAEAQGETPRRRARRI